MADNDFTGTADFFDSRDAEARIQALVAEFDLAYNGERSIIDEDMRVDDWRMYLDYDDAEELAALIALRTEADNEIGGDTWEDGITFIHDSYFEQFARDYADDIGAIDREAHWPAVHIDWEAAAASLQQDYSSVKFRGNTYWARD